LAAIRRLAHTTGQESHIESDGVAHKMVFNHGPKAGTIVRGSGTQFYSQAPKDMFSTLPSGEHFSHNFDFEKSEEIRLEHYSPKQGLKQIDPRFKGTGVDRSARRDTWHPHTFFYREGTTPESLVAQGSRLKYKVRLPATHKLYDLGTDPESHVRVSMQASHGALNIDDVHERLKSAGYKGFYNSGHPTLPHVVALYDAVDVGEEHDVTPRQS
jgi:hypothetical protein